MNMIVYGLPEHGTSKLRNPLRCLFPGCQQRGYCLGHHASVPNHRPSWPGGSFAGAGIATYQAFVNFALVISPPVSWDEVRIG